MAINCGTVMASGANWRAEPRRRMTASMLPAGSAGAELTAEPMTVAGSGARVTAFEVASGELRAVAKPGIEPASHAAAAVARQADTAGPLASDDAAWASTIWG